MDKFYEIADQRDRVLVARSSQPATAAVLLVVGGFHTPSITALLRNQQVPYVVVSPTAAGELDEALYQRLIRGQTAGLEQLVTIARTASDRHTRLAAAGLQPLAGIFTANGIPEPQAPSRVHAQAWKWVVLGLLLAAMVVVLQGDGSPTTLRRCKKKASAP